MPSGSGEDEENVKSLQTDEQTNVKSFYTDEQTDGRRKVGDRKSSLELSAEDCEQCRKKYGLSRVIHFSAIVATFIPA